VPAETGPQSSSALGEQPRVLGIDPGTRRVGLAVSDPLGLTAQGLDSFVRGRGSFLAHLETLARDYALARVVVGLPRRLDGGEGDAAAAARQLGARVQAHLKLPVELWDERMSSAAAHRAFPPGSRKDWDRLAAVFILQSWLDARAGAADESVDGEGPR